MYIITAIDSEPLQLTDGNTQFRTRGDQDVSFENIKVGIKVLVIGKPKDSENTVLAQVVGIQRSQK